MKLTIALALLALTLTTGFTCSKNTPTEEVAAPAVVEEATTPEETTEEAPAEMAPTETAPAGN